MAGIDPALGFAAATPVRTGAAASAGRGAIGCPHCGALQDLPRLGAFEAAACTVCASEIERNFGRSQGLALAFASAAALLLIPANLLPFLTTSVLGLERTSRLASSAAAMWTQGWPFIGIVIFACVVVLPPIRFFTLAAVLLTLRRGERPAWLGPAFRWANVLQTWAMPDVFLLGLWVAYARLAATVTVHMRPGAVCLIVAGICALFTRASLDKRAVWRAIAPERAPPADGRFVACEACACVVPEDREGEPCPRCGHALKRRRPNPLGAAAAFTAAGFLLYAPANLLPIASLPINLKPTSYTILGGVKDLVEAGLWGLAGLVFTASFAIPLLKLVGLGWCMESVFRRSDRRLKVKTRLFRLIEEIGRWSMVDPFTIACFVPVTQYNALISSKAEGAAPAFTAVVILTMVGAHAFDPRVMWDAARSRPPGRVRRLLRSLR